QLVAQHSCAHEGMLQVQFVNPAHQRQISRTDGSGQVVHRASADIQQLGLTGDTEVVVSVDHGFALSNPALVSACSKKSFSSVSCPILACSGTKSTAASCPTLLPKTCAAFS